MIVQLKFEVTDEERRALRAYVGEPGKATRDDIRRWIGATFRSFLGDVVSEWEDGKINRSQKKRGSK